LRKNTREKERERERERREYFEYELVIEKDIYLYLRQKE